MIFKPIAHLSPDESRDDQPLVDHLKNVGKLASQFAPLLPATGRLGGDIHDLGKYTFDFYLHITNQDASKVDHSTAGAQYLKSIAGDAWNNPVLAKAYMLPLVMPIISHHGGLRKVGSPSDGKESPTLYGRLKKDIPDYTVPDELKNVIQELLKESETELAAAYLRHCSDDLNDTSLELRLKYLLSALVDADWTDTKNFIENTKAERLSRETRENVFSHILSYINKKKNCDGINRYRSEILEHAIEAGNLAPGIYSLTAPTGSGKTISSLGFAATHALKYQKDRIIYVIPYNTIADQYYTELSDDMGLGDMVLEHTSSYDPGDDDEKHRELTSNWDSPVIITSAAQFFETLAASKTSKLRKLHNIANSVIIFDEVQNFPLPYSKYLLKMLRCLVEDYNCTILMMSATMMNFEVVDDAFAADEILPDPQKYTDVFGRSLLDDGPRVVKSDLGKVTYQDIIDRMLRYKSSICIVNRRKTAKELYRYLKDHADPDASCYCLTKDQHAFDRRRIISQIVDDLVNRKKCYVVSTSLIEAGIDISAECVLREFAGLESHIQAAGRCNRNGEYPHGYFGVFELTDEDPPRYLRSRHGIARAIYYAHDDPYTLDAIDDYFGRLLSQSDTDKRDILSLQRDMDYPEIAKSVKIIDEDLVSVIVPDQKIEDEIARLRCNNATKSDLRAIGQYTVEVPVSVARDHDNLLEYISDGMYILLDPDYYDCDIGLDLDQEISYII